MRLVPSCLAILLAGCAIPGENARPTLPSELSPEIAFPAEALPPHETSAQSAPGRSRERARARPRLEAGQELLQGYAGVLLGDSVELAGGSDGFEFAEDPDFDELPLFGGGGQWVLGGERIDLGVESGVSFSISADASAVLLGGNGALVAVDVDLYLLDFYGGFFASTFLGEHLRLFAAAGPLLQFAGYDQDGDDHDAYGSGLGLGYYGRSGLDFVLPNRTMVGVGVRWSDSTVDVGGDLGDLELEAVQVYLSVTTGL